MIDVERSRTLLVVSLLVFLVLSQCLIFVVDREPWIDVSFSLQTVDNLRVGGLGSVDFKQYDVHPPTHYYLLYGWSYLNPGFSEYH